MQRSQVPSLPSPCRHCLRICAAVLVVGLLFAAVACAPEKGGGSGGSLAGRYADAPVVLISLDTVRADHLPAYGFEGVETPALERLRRDGVLFERAWAHYPLTVPSHASIFTGALPTLTGVRDNVGYPLRANDFPYLPRLLREAGYRTGGAVSTFLLGAEAGFADGFEFYDDRIAHDTERSLAASQRAGGETLDRLLAWLDGVNDEPYFLFLHLYEAHTPYEPPEPFASRYADPYTGEIAAADAIVGRLLAQLDRRGDYERSLIVALSDHGEGLGDHGEAEHGVLLYREALQVPLLLKLPKDSAGADLAGTRISKGAQLADVAPTIRALVAAQPPADGVVPLLDLRLPAAEERKIYAETYYPRLRLGWSELTSVVEGDHHLIDGPDPELFDLAADAAEETNVLRDNRRVYAELDGWLERQTAELAAPSEVDEETNSRLASLGYLSSSAATGDGPLPDPKSRIHVLGELAQAFRLQGLGRHDEAVAAIRSVLADNPGLADGLEGLGSSLHALGRLDESIEAYQEAMRVTGGADRVALNLARVFLEAGSLDEAVSHAELASTAKPTEANLILARAAMLQERFDDAAKHARAALDARPGDVSGHLMLAEASIQIGDLDEAGRQVAAAEAARASRSGNVTPLDYYYVQGELAAQQGDGPTATRHFLREVASHPANLRAYTRLAFLYAFYDQPGEATKALRQMVAANPGPPAYRAAVETLRALGDEPQAARLLAYARQQYADAAALRDL